jgi:hypothetical protein
MYQWLDRAPKGRNETGIWWRRRTNTGDGVAHAGAADRHATTSHAGKAIDSYGN